MSPYVEALLFAAEVHSKVLEGEHGRGKETLKNCLDRLVAVVKRQRDFIASARIGADHVEAMKCEEDVDRIAAGKARP